MSIDQARKQDSSTTVNRLVDCRPIHANEIVNYNSGGFANTMSIEGSDVRECRLP